jgi:hypothetical protein
VHDRQSPRARIGFAGRPAVKGATPWVLSCVLIACGGAPDAAVEAQFAVARNATIPSGVRLADSSGPTRQAHMVSAEWSFDLQTDWDAYTSQGVAALERAGYETVDKVEHGLAFAKHIPGDSYRLRITRKGPASARVTVIFSVSPD